MRQAFEQRLDLVLEHPRHQPLAAVLVDLVQHEQRHAHGEAVARVAGLVQEAGAAVHAAQLDRAREGFGGDAGGLMAHQLVACELEQLGLVAALGAIPGLEGAAVVDVGRDLLVIKGEDQLGVDQHVLAARLVLQFAHLGHQALVGGQEGQRGVPLPFHQAFADEDLTGAGLVDPRERHAPAAVDHQAIQRGALQGHHLGLLFLPMRIEQLLAQQVAGDLLHPLRLDVGDAPAEQARGLDQFGADDPAARALFEVGAGMPVELDAARAQVFG